MGETSDTLMAEYSSLAAATAASPMQKIPLEVLLRITYFLSTPDLGTLRLACRAVEQALYTSFTNEFFIRKQFMISEDSLQTLINIAQSRIGPHLRKVHFGLERYPHALQHWSGTADDEIRYTRYLQRQASQTTLFATGYHREMLTEAFRSLENLEDVVLRDFNSHRRTRDGHGREWTSYGVPTQFEETGVRLNVGEQVYGSNSSRDFSSQVFSAIMFALGEAGARPSGIEVMSRNMNHLTNTAFNITHYMEPSVVPMLQRLEKLHLDVNLLRGRSLGFAGVRSNSMDGTDSLLRKFLCHTTQLKHLRINETHNESVGITSFLEWLGGSSESGSVAGYFPPPPPSPALEHLEELNLGSICVGPKTVMEVIRKFAPKLQRLELWKVNLMKNIPDGTTGSPPNVSFWNKFLERLLEVPGLDLHHIKIGNPQQQWIQRPQKSLAGFRTASGQMTNTMQYTGPDWKHYVGEMIPRLEVNYTRDTSFSAMFPGLVDGLMGEAALGALNNHGILLDYHLAVHPTLDYPIDVNGTYIEENDDEPPYAGGGLEFDMSLLPLDGLEGGFASDGDW